MPLASAQAARLALPFLCPVEAPLRRAVRRNVMMPRCPLGGVLLGRGQGRLVFRRQRKPLALLEVTRCGPRDLRWSDNPGGTVLASSRLIRPLASSSPCEVGIMGFEALPGCSR
ncbi:hypothetical protein NDU88_000682 [Pleurodeles waltl]|uniref:Uncharacterized protein n=1 Tax=Pleurodeles waltl TaxID=8319 RepID=A0AAV7U892_PLEWA|nr:hypothetical protein NDU88_000682 [Pleurodeles waltl]